MVVLESGYTTFETNRPINYSYILDSVLIEPTIRRVIEGNRKEIRVLTPLETLYRFYVSSVARDGGGKLISTIYPRFNGDNRRRSSMDHEAIIAIILSIFMIGNAVKLTSVFQPSTPSHEYFIRGKTRLQFPWFLDSFHSRGKINDGIEWLAAVQSSTLLISTWKCLSLLNIVLSRLLRSGR